MGEQRPIERIDTQSAAIAEHAHMRFCPPVAAIDDHRLAVGKFEHGAIALPYVDKMNAELPFAARRQVGRIGECPKVFKGKDEQVETYQREKSRRQYKRGQIPPQQQFIFLPPAECGPHRAFGVSFHL